MARDQGHEVWRRGRFVTLVVGEVLLNRVRAIWSLASTTASILAKTQSTDVERYQT